MHFVGVTARWLQSIEPRIPSWSWQRFCHTVHGRFGREQHELLIHKLFHIRQTSTVQDYVDRFSELVDVLVTYEHTTDPIYYTMHFIDGLRDDSKSDILVQRPGDLDTACALALLQEEADSSKRRDSRGLDASWSGRSQMKQLQAPPPRWDKSLGGEPVISKQTHANATPTAPDSVASDSQVASLRAYRLAHGLLC